MGGLAPFSPMPTLLQRLARLAPYFRSGRLGLAVAFAGSLVMAADRAADPGADEAAARQRLRHRQACALWMVPVAMIGLFAVRGAAGFVGPVRAGLDGQPGRAEAAQRDVRAPAGRRSRTLFTRHTRQQLTNTLVYEVQTGRRPAGQPPAHAGARHAHAGGAAGLPAVAELAAHAVRGRAVPGGGAGRCALLGSRLHRLTLARASRPPTSWPTWSRKTCWPGASCACTARRSSRRSASARAATALRRLMLKIGGRSAHDDAGDADAGGLRAVGGDRRRAVAEPHAAAPRWAASSPSSPPC